MPRVFIKRSAFIFFAMLLLLGCLTPTARSFFGLPTHYKMYVGDSLASLSFPRGFLNDKLVWEVSNDEIFQVTAGEPMVARTPGRCIASLKLFGIIPLRHIAITAVPLQKVVPGGQSIGVLLHPYGVQIVGEAPITTVDGYENNPALEAGLRIGDMILKINSEKMVSDLDVKRVIDQAGARGDSLHIVVKRRGKVLAFNVKPRYCPETDRYRIGVLIRDSAAGVGTLSFYSPKTNCFGALGHMITDGYSAQRMELSDGKIVEAFIQDIRSAKKGQPGEKLGIFYGSNNIAGTISKNTVYGIFGTLHEPIANSHYKKTIPVALLNQIEVGPAEMLTVIDGNKIERFSLEIEEVRPEAFRDGKGLIIRITDDKLLRRTGGIIQGMSGSPIIQNGKLVGAITHVFINNPARGYGVPAEWMIRECGLLKQENLQGNRETSINSNQRYRKVA
ncbi:MAG: SpoIVB peptidase [Peptococcaceae bacterium]|nr:SpoIVB peptidase [Peptococcaceae bacterium]